MAAHTNLNRAGEYVIQPGGIKAFHPARLPFVPPVEYYEELRFILSMADQAIGRLDSSAEMIPNPDLFVGMYVWKEAVLSSWLEWVIQASLSDVLKNGSLKSRNGLPPDFAEVIEYVTAMNHALARIDTIPLITRREEHRQRVQNATSGSGHSIQLLDFLFKNPYVDVNLVPDRLGVSYPTANILVRMFTQLQTLVESTGRDRNRRFRYSGYLDLMEQGLSAETDNESDSDSIRTIH